MKSVGSFNTPDSLAYDLRYAQQERTDEGGRQIVLATDRPIGFWEFHRQSRTVQYPFTVIQMEIGKDGEGKGTLSYATKIIPAGDNTIVPAPGGETGAVRRIVLTLIDRKTPIPKLIETMSNR